MFDFEIRDKTRDRIDLNLLRLVLYYNTTYPENHLVSHLKVIDHVAMNYHCTHNAKNYCLSRVSMSM
jgi:hypothetical protein